VNEWLRLIAEQEASEQTQEEWCLANGVNLYTYRDRASRLRKMDNEGIIGKPMFSRNKNELLCSTVTKHTGWVEVKPNEGLQTEADARRHSNLVIEVGALRIQKMLHFRL